MNLIRRRVDQMSKKWELYNIGDKLDRKRKSCPKCGGGVFLAQHEDRLSCGLCGYTEFTKKRDEVKPDVPDEKTGDDVKDEAAGKKPVKDETPVEKQENEEEAGGKPEKKEEGKAGKEQAPEEVTSGEEPNEEVAVEKKDESLREKKE